MTAPQNAESWSGLTSQLLCDRHIVRDRKSQETEPWETNLLGKSNGLGKTQQGRIEGKRIVKCQIVSVTQLKTFHYFFPKGPFHTQIEKRTVCPPSVLYWLLRSHTVSVKCDSHCLAKGTKLKWNSNCSFEPLTKIVKFVFTCKSHFTL